MTGYPTHAPPACSVMIFIRDEEVHLPSCLESLRWCDDVIVIDSFSTDRSLAICQAAGVRVFQRAFDGFGSQRNWALEGVQTKHDWVLILDADERVVPEMVQELRHTLPAVPAEVAAFRVARRFYMWGRWLRHSSLYPIYVVRLVRKGRVKYVNRGHAETQLIDGVTAQLRTDLIDENLKGLEEWFARQNRYSSREAEYELEQAHGAWRARNVASGDPVARRAALKQLAARLPGRPLWYFLYSFVLRGGFRDGYDGLMFCIMKSIYEAMVSVKKYDLQRMRKARVGARSGSQPL
jgi:glycosyltransferase involved in cell wall biosynthesis